MQGRRGRGPRLGRSRIEVGGVVDGGVGGCYGMRS